MILFQLEVEERAKPGMIVQEEEFSYEVPVKDGDVIVLKAVDVLGHETLRKLTVKVDKNCSRSDNWRSIRSRNNI